MGRGKGVERMGRENGMMQVVCWSRHLNGLIPSTLVRLFVFWSNQLGWDMSKQNDGVATRHCPTSNEVISNHSIDDHFTRDLSVINGSTIPFSVNAITRAWCKNRAYELNSPNSSPLHHHTTYPFHFQMHTHDSNKNLLFKTPNTKAPI